MKSQPALRVQCNRDFDQAAALLDAARLHQRQSLVVVGGRGAGRERYGSVVTRQRLVLPSELGEGVAATVMGLIVIGAQRYREIVVRQGVLGAAQIEQRVGGVAEDFGVSRQQGE